MQHNHTVGLDYEPLSLTLTFNVSEVQCFQVTVIDDNIFEFDEFFRLNWFTPTSQAIDINTFVVVRIVDDEGMKEIACMA